MLTELPCESGRLAQPRRLHNRKLVFFSFFQGELHNNCSNSDYSKTNDFANNFSASCKLWVPEVGSATKTKFIVFLLDAPSLWRSWKARAANKLWGSFGESCKVSRKKTSRALSFSHTPRTEKWMTSLKLLRTFQLHFINMEMLCSFVLFSWVSQTSAWDKSARAASVSSEFQALAAYATREDEQPLLTCYFRSAELSYLLGWRLPWSSLKIISPCLALPQFEFRSRWKNH